MQSFFYFFAILKRCFRFERKHQKYPESIKLFKSQIIWLGGSIVKDNKYLEEFNINLVKQYLQGKQQKDICKEYVLQNLQCGDGSISMQTL